MKMSEKDRYVIFDFDGTLVDTIDSAISIFNGIAHEYDMKPLRENERELIRTKRPQELLKTFGVSKMKLTTLMLRLRKEMVQAIPSMKMIAGMKGVLQQMKKSGCKLGILTSNSKRNVTAFLEINELTDTFDFIYSGKNLFGKGKIINRMLSQEDIPKGQAIYVGDETRDVEASQKTGIPVIAVSWGLSDRQILEQMQPNGIVDSPDELPGCITQIFGG